MKVIKGVVLTSVMISLASTIITTASGKELSGKPMLTATQRQTVIQNVPVRAKSIRIAKPKLFRTNPHRAVHYAIANNPTDDFCIQDDDLITAYRRRDLAKIQKDTLTNDHEELSEDIRWRLFLARQLAVLKHMEKWG